MRIRNTERNPPKGAVMRFRQKEAILVVHPDLKMDFKENQCFRSGSTCFCPTRIRTRIKLRVRIWGNREKIDFRIRMTIFAHIRIHIKNNADPKHCCQECTLYYSALNDVFDEHNVEEGHQATVPLALLENTKGNGKNYT